METMKIMSKQQPSLKLSEQIRAAVEGSGVSAYRISADTKLDKAALSRFMSGTRGLSMESLDTLAGYLGLQIVRPAQTEQL
jgi:transcriptional regulator with XRE-family HTH domain